MFTKALFKADKLRNQSQYLTTRGDKENVIYVQLSYFPIAVIKNITKRLLRAGRGYLAYDSSGNRLSTVGEHVSRHRKEGSKLGTHILNCRCEPEKSTGNGGSL